MVGNTANVTTQGVWQYSSDGVNWNNIGSVNDTGSSLVIASGAKLRFLSVANYNGTPTDLVVRGLDDTYAGLLSTTASGESRQTLDTSSPSAISAFSLATANLSTSVTPANDTPILSTLTDTSLDDPSTQTIFSGVTITDTDGDNVTVTITLSDNGAHGGFTTATLATGGFSDDGSGVYSRTAGTAASAGNRDSPARL